LYFIVEASDSNWSKSFNQCPKTNMLQSWQYGNSKNQSTSWSVVRFLILDNKENVVGLVQALVKKLSVIGAIVRINRGPILTGIISPEEKEKETVVMIKFLLEEFKRRRWYIVQIAPEIEKSNLSHLYLKNLGLRKLKHPTYSSGLLDISVEKKELLLNLKKKWRYYLKQGQKKELRTDILKGDSYEVKSLIKNYKKLQNRNNFLGVSEALIKDLARQSGKGWEFSLLLSFRAKDFDAEEPLGMVVYVRHGNTSTYFIGLTSQEGRNLHVNYVLLWNAILDAKAKGCRWFDIGGMDSTTPKGIAHFKSGLNSNLYELSGEWRLFLNPWKSLK
jgi:lipid II:glycine glycyltransferase (peptidoglycan interpeptide bridge formation enzyme)